MVVTADPLGDFNANSQILRYSALAREVTVPRVPSITATILATAPLASTSTRSISPVQHHHHQQQQPRPFVAFGSGAYRNYSPAAGSDDRTTMEIAALEIARLSDELDQTRAEVEEQASARMAAEAHLLTMEDRMLDLETTIREDCATEFEQRLALELARWKTSMALQQERNDEHWDRKIEVLERGLHVANIDDDEEADKENVLVEDLQEELERLRRENAVLKRELAGRSPTKRRPLQEREDFAPTTASASRSAASSNNSASDNMANLGRKLERMRVSDATSSRSGSNPAITISGGSPKKVRRLGAKRWQEPDEPQ